MRTQTLAVIAVGALITGLLFAQNGSESESSEDIEWQMFGTSVAIAYGDSDDDSDDTATEPLTQQGLAFLYNKRTGKVYRFFESCGSDGEYGCFDDMPVLDGTMSSTLPSAQSTVGRLPTR